MRTVAVPGPPVVRQERVLPTRHRVPHLRPAQVVQDRMEVRMHWAVPMVLGRLLPEGLVPCILQLGNQGRDRESRPRWATGLRACPDPSCPFHLQLHQVRPLPD